MAAQPSGIVSFLFTDVAGSTRLWDSDRVGMESSLAAHDRIMRAAIETHEGFVFSIAGDSFGAAFTTAEAALAAALQAQRALTDEPWAGPAIRVRMGIHTGSSQERAGNYFGPEVNRAARVMSAANGGQVLVSGVTAELLAGVLGEGLTLTDRGVHSLKDLDRPEHLYELRHPDLPGVADPLHTADVGRVHLPGQLTSFVGRRVEMESVDRMVAAARLVTLTGVGGTGKTRLAVAAASKLGDDFPDGVWMVELAPVTDPELVVNEVAELWGLRPGEGVTLLQVIKLHLANRRMLLVVDNCEHLLTAAASLVGELLGSTPGLKVIATSRESLGVAGEVVYHVPSMGLAGDSADPTTSDAVILFLDRAGRVRPDFDPGPDDLEAIVRICRRLDGIPLGLELAAARLRTLAPAELADRLDDSFRILTGSSKTAVPRQRTLQTTIDWSYDLLDEADASLFRRLSVFAGGFDLAAAEVVGASEVVEDWEVIDRLDQLVDKSLVVVAHDGQTNRFRMLEPIRQYGQERLASAGEAAEAHLTHARYYADLVRASAPRFRGPEQRQANEDLIAEIDNIRSALETTLDIADYDGFLDACFDLQLFWAHSSLQLEGRQVILSGLEAAGDAASPVLTARAWMAASMLAFQLTDPRAVVFADRGYEIARQAGEQGLQGWLALMRGMAESAVGDRHDRERWFEEGVRLVAEHPDPPLYDQEWDRLWTEISLVFGQAGSRDDRRRRVIDAIDRARALGDGYMTATALTLAADLGDEDDADWAISSLREGVDMLRRLGFRHGLGHSLFYLGMRTQDVGAGDGVEELAEASRTLAEVGDVPCSVWSAGRLIGALLERGDLDEAADQIAAAAARLQVFETDVDSDLSAHACRLAIARGDPALAARLLGHASTRNGAPDSLAVCRAEVASALAPTELERLTAEGAAADRRLLERWIDEVARVGQTGDDR